MKAGSGFVAAIAALAGLTGEVRAADTTIKYEVSTDGSHWSSTVEAHVGDRVEVRTRVIWTGAAQVLAFAGVSFQPVVSGWTDSDTLLTTPGTPGDMGVGPVGGARSTPSANVPDAPGVYGRISPFAFAATTTTSFLRGFVGTGTAAGLLRIARSNATNWIGVGPTSGSQTFNNWSALAGVQPGQIPPPARIATDPPLNMGLDVAVFKFGYVVGAADGQPRDMVIDTPIEGIGRDINVNGAFYGRIYAAWYLSLDDAFGTRFYDSVSVESAGVHVVPSPGVSLLALAAAAAVQRRRRG